MSANDWPITVDERFGCWLWTARVSSNGYAITWGKSTPLAAKRVVYEREVGAIAGELVLDHACRDPLCVRPSHMEPVTKDENERRKSWRVRARRATCPRGHDLKLNAIVTPNGGRVCRECNRGVN